MPICLPHGDKFPDEAGVVYEAGWGSNHDCNTNDKGPDPFSKCKFPFFSEDAGLALPLNQCLLTKSPSAKNKDCQDLYQLMRKRKGNTTSFLDQGYGRVNAETASNH